MLQARQNLRIQKWVAAFSVLLLIVKFGAWYITSSVAILTDAWESIVNVMAGFIGLYSLYVAAKPRDADHPYGHGKAEFVSAAAEGSMISIAGVLIIYEAVRQLLHPAEIRRLDTGIWLVAGAGLVNFLVGHWCVRVGRRNNSLALVASGSHLKTDTYSTIGIIAGLMLIWFTGLIWIDGVVALVLGGFIVYTGYGILRRSLAGIMDEADEQIIGQLVTTLNGKRPENWVDLHNLRVIKYGSILHIDCHLTVPWYLNVNEAHREIDHLSVLARQQFGESVELFVHNDGCLPVQCPICSKGDCPVRQQPFRERITWTLQNISTDKKHQLNTI
ncbi:MAG: cation transporter [Chitinophagaceae bacterium]|nr:MAG: cation transporter [Chitinophagaceae bacterium]